MVHLNQVTTLRAGTGANQINRRDLTREGGHHRQQLQAARPVSADNRDWRWPASASHRATATSSAARRENMAESFACTVSALAMALIFIYMILASQFKASCSRWRW